MSIRIAPSLLSADFSRLADEVADVERGGADLLHLDIMDGHFVPNLTFGPPVVRAIASHSKIALDAHLMVANPDNLIDDLIAAPVARIAVHVEVCDHLQRTLENIRTGGVEAGIAVNPASALSLIEDALPWADFVLIMSVNPGFGGQDFIPETLEKISRLRQMAAGRPLDIAVDGGVCLENVASLANAGATTLVAGSAIFGLDDRASAIADLRLAATVGGKR
ncbi:ribulose-phosphate 3-epimerase [Acidobacteriota bacterium]